MQRNGAVCRNNRRARMRRKFAVIGVLCLLRADEKSQSRTHDTRFLYMVIRVFPIVPSRCAGREAAACVYSCPVFAGDCRRLHGDVPSSMKGYGLSRHDRTQHAFMIVMGPGRCRRRGHKAVFLVR